MLNTMSIPSNVVVESIKVEVKWNPALRVWMCKESSFSFCKRKFQDRSACPDCSNCALRRTK